MPRLDGGRHPCSLTMGRGAMPMLRVPRPTTRWEFTENESDGDWELIAGVGALAAVVATLTLALYWAYFVGSEDLAGPAGAEIVWKLWSR
jgi:hypothetical protein